ncbi:MAG TPA: acyl-CoA dehydrogenase [Eoetvoesiella sp.]
MSFDLVEIQAFKDSARDFLTRDNQGERIRKLIVENRSLDRDFWQQIAESGWPAILVPEEQGGLGLGVTEAVAIAEEVGRSYISEPVVQVAVQAVSLLNALPHSDLRSELLEKIADGSFIIGTAWQHRLGQLEPEYQANSVPVNDGLIVDAVFTNVMPADGADGWLVVAGVQNEAVLAWIPASQEGVAVQSLKRVDGSSAGTLTLTACQVSADQVLARGSDVLTCVSTSLDLARIALSAQLLGVARQAFDTTLEYMGVRVQFGKPIGSFQSLQHRMVDAYIQIQLLDYAIAQAIELSTQDSAALAMQASRLKVRADQAASLVTRLAVQIHGGMGYSDESDVGLGLKRALGLASELGNARTHKKRYFAELSKMAHNRSGAGTADELVAWDNFPKEADWEAMSEQDFRQMLRAFFTQNYPEHLRHKASRLHWHEIKDWYKTLSEQGWIAPAWPKEYGGMALSPDKMIAYIEEQERYGVGRPPDQGLVMLGPILFRYGTPEQKAKYLPPILSGEHVWAQGYSEPNAGSDLASLRCEAVLEGGHFVVNGQKTWSTLAQDATHMFMLVRTDKTVKKQAGISFLMVDLSTPGVLVRPIKTIAGDEEYCEVFFDNVKVPQENLVGEINQGWTISKALLGFERLFSGSPKHSQNTMGMIEKIAAQTGLFDDDAFAGDYAQLHIDVADLSAAYAAFSEIVRRNEPLPANVSLLKIWATETHEKTSLLLLEAAQEHAGAVGKVEFHVLALSGAKTAIVEDVQMPLYNAAAAKIFSGTNEIQRNILAKVVLGLPT